jgi:hypothetical protein
MFIIFFNEVIHLKLNKSDIIDIILNKGLGSFSYEEKCNLKGKRPTLRLSLEYKEAKTSRKFKLY